MNSETLDRLPVFVYGTLRPGEKNYPLYLQGKTIREIPATTPGELFFVEWDGGYPYVVPGEGTVRGDLVEIAPEHYATTLRALDELEEYDPNDEAGSVYLRRRAAVHLEGGRKVEGWIYYWNCPDRRGIRIDSGDFKLRRN